jgi:hypothetical protein
MIRSASNAEIPYSCMCPSLAKLAAQHYRFVHVYCLAILSWHCRRLDRSGDVASYKAIHFPRRHVRDMDFLHSVALSELQNAVSEESSKLVAFALNNLPQMWTRSNPAIMVSAQDGWSEAIPINSACDRTGFEGLNLSGELTHCRAPQAFVVCSTQIRRPGWKISF